VERWGRAIRVMIILVNWQQEEPKGSSSDWQHWKTCYCYRLTAVFRFMDGTSRVNGEIYARFCERLWVKLAGPTHSAAGSDARPYRDTCDFRSTGTCRASMSREQR